MAALNRILTIAQQYMFYPGKVENWIILIDTHEIGLISFPYSVYYYHNYKIDTQINHSNLRSILSFKFRKNFYLESFNVIECLLGNN